MTPETRRFVCGMAVIVAALSAAAIPAVAQISPTPPAALNTNAPIDSVSDHTAQVTTDGLGNWVAVWSTNDVMVSRSSDNGATWAPPAAINTNDSIYSVPALATDRAGLWIAVWGSSNSLGGTIGSDDDILVSRSINNGATWTAAAALNTNAAVDSGYDNYVRIATDRAGNWVAVWQSLDTLGGTIGGEGDILVSRSSNNGATWTAPAALNTNAGTDAGSDTLPDISTDALGRWVAVWYSTDTLGGTIGSDEDILVSRSTNNGATWTAPAPLNTNAATDVGNDYTAKVAADGLGNWVAVWSSFNSLGGTIGGEGDILVSRSVNNGATWTAPAPLNSNAGTDSGFDTIPTIVTDGAGNWIATWNSNDTLGGTIGADNDVLVSRSTDDGATWSALSTLNTNAATDSGADSGAQVATDDIGNWVAVWVSNDTLGGTIGTDGDILVSRFTLGGGPAAPAARPWAIVGLCLCLLLAGAMLMLRTRKFVALFRRFS